MEKREQHAQAGVGDRGFDGFGSRALAARFDSRKTGTDMEHVICGHSGLNRLEAEIVIGLTQEYLGEKGMQKWGKPIQRDNVGACDSAMSNGIYCNARKQKCIMEKFSDVMDDYHTRMLLQ